MKKRLSFLITSFVLVLVFAVSGGCTFVSGKSPAGFFDDTERVNSQTVAENVEFAVETGSRVKMEDEDAVAKVERSSVAIMMGNGSGSGVLVDLSFKNTGSDATWKSSDKYVFIITCHHVVSDMGEITVYIPDQDYNYDNSDYVFKGYIGNRPYSEYEDQGYAVTLVGGDFEADIAILKLNLDIAATSGRKLSADKLVLAKFADFDSGYTVRRGERVFAIGNPTGRLPGSCAFGEVSYLERATGVNEIGDMRLMQISVSTNPGNSGGGLYNLYGELIGITNAGNTEYTDINFAIPCYLSNGNGFMEIGAQLCASATQNNYGYVSGRREKFGFSVQEETANGNTYVVVSAVTDGGLAAKAGLKVGDVISSVKINSGETVSVTTTSQFTAEMNKLKIGDSFVLSGVRTVSKGFWSQQVDFSAELTCKAFWFCDTGNYEETSPETEVLDNAA